eukprot:3520970-Pleurochrysis_carterae.AAC.1
MNRDGSETLTSNPAQTGVAASVCSRGANRPLTPLLMPLSRTGLALLPEHTRLNVLRVAAAIDKRINGRVDKHIDIR